MGVATFGLTGGIGSGKSLVGRHFSERGVPVVDADELARLAVAPGEPALARIASRFGADVLGPDGALVRSALAKIVFGDPLALRELEAIVHPRVQELLRDRLREIDRTGRATACYEVPLLFEKGLDAQFSPVVVVVSSEATRIARVVARDGSTPDDVRKRIANQWPLERKAQRADFVIYNDGTIEETKRQADDVLRRVHERLGVPCPF